MSQDQMDGELNYARLDFRDSSNVLELQVEEDSDISDHCPRSSLSEVVDSDEDPDNDPHADSNEDSNEDSKSDLAEKSDDDLEGLDEDLDENTDGYSDTATE
ncbi:MAG: hypothetical protein Q9176_006989 [Flavoplaca citrina]